MNMTPRIDKVEGLRDIPSEHSHYYVVLRDGRRVSDSNHLSTNAANAEKSYWQNILGRWPDGTKVEIYKCENKNYKS
jgi:hypothetical protein